MKKRILIFSLAYFPYVGGAEVAIKEITDRIGEDFSFDMVTLQFANKDLTLEKIGNLTIYRKKVPFMPVLIQKLLFPFIAFMKARQLQNKENYDLVWSIMASYAGFAGVIFKRHFPKIPFLLTIQEGENFGRRKIFKFLFKKIFRRANRITVISNFLADWSRQMGAVCPVELVPNGVDLSRFQIPDSKFNREDTRHRFEFKDTDTVLITTSRLVPKNRVGDVIDAMKFLPENVKFLILGSGPLESSLKLSVKSYKLESRVTFIGFVSHSQLPSYLHCADIFIRTPISEGFGNSFVEAMASGLPVIATPVGGIVDFVVDGETGLFVRVSDPKGIAEKVERLIRDKELCEKITLNSSKIVTERYDWTFVAVDMREALLKTIDSK